MLRIKRLLLKAFERCGGFKLLQWRQRHRPVILMYHRIIDQHQIAGLAPAEFEQQLAYIAQRYRVVPINSLLQEVAEDRVQPYSLALTFDDGHCDFYQNAWPLLQKYQLPASLYVTTGFVDGSLWLWPDLLKYLLLTSPIKQFNLPSLGAISLAEPNFLTSWHQLGDHCLSLSSAARSDFIEQLAHSLNTAIPSAPLSPFTAVTWAQLQEMQQQGLDVGSHTVSHPILSSLSSPQLERELGAAGARIQAQLGQFPIGICYPNGRPCDINPQVTQMAQQLGYSYGLMGRNLGLDKNQPFVIGRLAAHHDFNYFKWTLCRQPEKSHTTYLG
jgi:peptidoglycan/xylan/chitin deacetylase (PgdA/CDA1 family)